MKTLYLDTAYNQVVGICDERGQWLCFQETVGQKSSAQLHADLHRLCESKAVRAADITSVIYVAGPGFYTGLRIGYGVAQTLKLSGVTSAAFNAYDVPALLGESDYTWITKAYRGEVFVYQSNSKTGTLITDQEFHAQDWSGKLYVHHARALDDRMRAKLGTTIETEGLIVQNFVQLLPHFTAELPLHYFRAPEDEFRPST